jgi:hypothetical protein
VFYAYLLANKAIKRHTASMSKRLRDALNQVMDVEGAMGKARLCAAVRKSLYTLDRWLRDGVPTAKDAYDLAVAAGLSTEEARAIAEETRTSRARETA